LIRLAGVLYLACSLVSVPATLALEPVPPLSDFVVLALGILGGCFFLFAPRVWIKPYWIYAAVAGAIGLIAVAVALISDDFAFLYVVNAIYAAVALRSRTALGIFIVVTAVALLAPLVYADDTQEQLHHILITLPVYFISLFFVRYLRNMLELRERTYRDFADEAISLAHRIRRSSGTVARDDETERRLDELAASTRRASAGSETERERAGRSS
jgi:hypothetical protein